MRQIGQSPASDDVTSGCIGHTYAGVAVVAAGGLRRLATAPTATAAAAPATRKIQAATIAAIDPDSVVTDPASALQHQPPERPVRRTGRCGGLQRPARPGD